MSSPTLSHAHSQVSQRGRTVSLGGYWHRISLFAIITFAAVLNFIGLSREGYGNQYYAAAVKSMSGSWHNFLFTSFDPGGFVSIDKPPLGFWFQVASVKVFGFSGVALLIPQALAGVLSVALLYYLVTRTFGRPAGLIAALALAITPISVVTNRNNTIDSTLVLVVLLGAWAVLRASETGKLRWLLLCAAFVGLGFNIKMLQAYLVLPAFGLVYVLGTRKSVWRRIRDLLIATVVLLAISFSWVTAVDLTPASQRPWVDSTTTNSALDLAIGYNGLQRLTGSRGGASIGRSRTTSLSGAGSVRRTGFPGGGQNGGPGGIGENGPTGPLRLLDTQLGSQIGWFLPLAILGFLIALWQTRPRFKTLDERQRSLVMWGMWLLTTGVFFSVALFYHTYYLVMMAPAVSALAGIALVSLWAEYRRARSRVWWMLPLSLLAVGGVQAHLLASYPSWARWLTPLVGAGCVLAAMGLIFLRIRPVANLRAAVSAVALGVGALMAPPAVWAANTAQHTATGAILRAGPPATGVVDGGGNFARGSFAPRGGAFRPPSGATPGPPPKWAFGPPAGGGPRTNRVSPALVTFLQKHRGSAKFVVATTSSNEAAPIVIAIGAPVMSLGGFSGSDPILTTAKMVSLVNAGMVRYFMLGGRGGPGSDGSSGVTSWVTTNCSTVPTSKYSTESVSGGFDGNQALYDCGAVR